MARASRGSLVYRTALFVLFLVFAAVLVLAPANARAGSVHRDLEARLASQAPGALIPVIVVLEAQANPAAAAAAVARNDRRGRGRAVVDALRDMAQRSQPPVLSFLGREQAQGTVREVHAFWIINGFAVTATEAAIRRIAARPDVREVRFDAAIAPPVPKRAATPAPAVSGESAWNIAQVRAPEVWAVDPRYDGTGIVIGSFDTGVDGTHPDLAPRYRGNHAISWFDPYNQHASPYDNNGHGTHTTGTALGGDASGVNIGVAPGARWIAAKAWNDRDDATVSAFHRIFEWFLAPGGDPANAPHVVNSSWGQSPPDCYGDFLPDLRAMRAAGIFPAFASGNEGPGAGTALGPGNFAEAFSVGATDFDDAVADFSSQGPSQCDGAIKPDISAPGVAILSALPGDFHFELDGTSMATPHVSGAVAVLLSIDPALSVDDLESALVLGAVDVGPPGPDNLAGVGRLDLLASASIVLGVPRVGITATAADAFEAGAIPGRFRVTRTAPLDAPLTVTYAVGGTATAGSDYVALPGSVTLPAGVGAVDIVVTPIDDAVTELDETVVVTLAPDPAYLLSPPSATVRIVSDELLPDYTVFALSAPAAAGAGAAITVGDTTKNTGAGPAPATVTRYYLSANATLDASDLLLGSRPVAALAPGGSDSGSAVVTIPAGTASGAYFVIAKADGDDALLETLETNNLLWRSISIGADLVVSSFSVPGVAGAGLPMTVGDTTTNQGGGTAGASTITFYLSTDPALDAADVALGSRAVPALAGGASSAGTVALTIPAGTATGTWYVIARADSGDAVTETSEANNVTNRSVVVGPDLGVTALGAPASSGAGASITATDTTKNTGGGAAPATVTRFYLSSNTTLDAADTLLGSRAVAALAPGESDSGSTALTIPAGTASGTWYLIAKADGADALAESQEFNNLLWRPITIGADLLVTSLTVPGVAGAGLSMTIADTVANQGGSAAAASTVGFYLSADAVLDAGDVLLGTRAVPSLAGGASSSGSTAVTMPAGTATGSYYLFARADSADAVVETSETNNTTNRTVVVGPDLTVTALTAPASAGAGAAFTVGDTTRNTGGGAAPATVTRYYLSSNTAVDAADVLLGSRAVPALAPGAADTGTASVTIPPGTPAGAYYLVAKSDGDDALAETQEFNNVLWRPLSVGPDLVVTAFTVPGVAGAGLAMSVTDTTANPGGAAAGASTLAFFLSTDAVLDAGDVPLGTRAVGALAAGASSSATTSLLIPAGTAMGTYYVFARADAGEAVAETSEANNTIYRTVLVGADLTVTAFSAPATGGAGASLTVTDTTKNTGGGAAPATVTRYFLSTNSVLDAADVVVGSRAVAALAPNASDSGSATLAIPAGTPSGAYFLIARADGDDALAETQESNNVLARPITLGADLHLPSLTVPGIAGAGLPIALGDTTANQGGSAAGASTLTWYLSTNPVLDPADVVLGSRAVSPLAAGASESGTVSAVLPAGLAPGMYYAIARADSGDAVVETSEGNNTAYRTVVVGPDLVINAFGASATAGAGAAITVSDTTKNTGGGAAPATTTRYYLSTNTTLDAADVLLGSRAVGALAPNASDSGSATVTIPAGTASGAYYLIARADGDDTLPETQESNNLLWRPISIGPDLVVAALTVPGVGGAGIAMSVGHTTTNQGGSAAVATTLAFYLSANASLDAADVLLGTVAVPALAAGASDTGTASLTIPEGTAMGLYYVFARADPGDAVAETSETNNVATRSVLIGPDLTITAFTAASSVAPGTTLAVSDTTKNVGGGASPAGTTRFYLSTNTTLDAADVLLGSRPVAALAPNGADSASVTLAIPAGLAPGAYYLIAKADGDDTLAETQEFNNLFWRPLQLTP